MIFPSSGKGEKKKGHSSTTTGGVWSSFQPSLSYKKGGTRVREQRETTHGGLNERDG